MEYVDGADLKGLIEHRKKTSTPFPVEEACLICVRICEGLSYAHELTDNNGESLHIVHRDMSPPNVLIHALRGSKNRGFRVGEGQQPTREE